MEKEIDINHIYLQSNSHKELLSSLIEKIKSNQNEDEQLIKESLEQLIHLIEMYGIPIASLLILPDNVNFIFQLYFENKSQDLVVKLITKLLEVFNFQMISDSPNAELIEACNQCGIDINLSYLRTELTKEEKLYDMIMNLKTYWDMLKSISTSEDNIEKDNLPALQEQYQECKNIFEEIKKDINCIKPNLEFYSDLLSQLNKLDTCSTNNNNNNVVNINDFNYANHNMNMEISPSSKVQNSISFMTIKDYVSDIELKKRKFFYLNENLQDAEGTEVEYKNYLFPLKFIQVEELKKQICAFLNSRGGRIYIGVTDLKVVKGIPLNYKQKDLIRNDIINSTYDFYPKCRTKKIDVIYIPIKKFNTQTFINNMYIIKIIVRQGDTNKLYSICNKGYISYLRLPGQCANLTAEEIYEEIIKRHTNPAVPIDEKEFEDPEPEQVPGYDSNGKGSSNYGNNGLFYPIKKGKNGKFYSVKVTNITMQATSKELEKLFAHSGAVSMKFFTDARANKGYGFLNFQSLEEANNVVKKFNDFSFKGKKIELKIKDYK